MKARNPYRRLTIEHGDTQGAYWEAKRPRETVLCFRVRTEHSLAGVYVKRIELGAWCLCAFRLPLQAIVESELRDFPIWSAQTPLLLELTYDLQFTAPELAEGKPEPMTFEIRPVCVGDDVDGAS